MSVACIVAIGEGQVPVNAFLMVSTPSRRSVLVRLLLAFTALLLLARMHLTHRTLAGERPWAVSTFSTAAESPQHQPAPPQVQPLPSPPPPLPPLLHPLALTLEPHRADFESSLPPSPRKTESRPVVARLTTVASRLGRPSGDGSAAAVINESAGALDDAAPASAIRPAAASSQCLQPSGYAAGGRAVSLTWDLLVLILSSQQKQLTPARRREAVRRSWVRDVVSTELGGAEAPAADRCSVRHYFVVGGGQRVPHLRGEDVLVLPVEDGYTEIVHKVIGALRWALVQAPAKYVLKTDDDSFLCAARLLELLRSAPRERAYLGVINPHHHVITTAQRDARYERWRDVEYVRLFNRTVYAPYMQGAGYVLSADLAALVVQRADALRTLPKVEDALVGTLVEGVATALHRPSCFRHKNRDDYAVTVCERDTEFVLLHKLDENELARCHAATQRRRSARCPRGPCACRSLGHKPRRPRRLVSTFEQAAELQGGRDK